MQNCGTAVSVANISHYLLVVPGLENGEVGKNAYKHREGKEATAADLVHTPLCPGKEKRSAPAAAQKEGLTQVYKASKKSNFHYVEPYYVMPSSNSFFLFEFLLHVMQVYMI